MGFIPAEKKGSESMDEEDIYEPTPEEQEQINQALQAIAYDIDSGRPLEDIINELVENGLDKDTATQLVNAVKEEVERIRSEEDVVNILASRLYEGEDPETIIDELTEAGMDKDEATEFISELNDQVQAIKKEEDMVFDTIEKGVKDGKSVDEIVSDIEGLNLEIITLDNVREFVEDVVEDMKSES